ncbi:MAG: restriction endonuclease subunit S [Bacteroidales bacterium]|nr:restriction endonuclease subunit S [Bacteroidales bacterium]MCF8456415.1 restriction endonuclease subunit S [Bacteroidales bacterium]
MSKENRNIKPFYNTTIPSDWEEVHLGKVFKLTSGKTKPCILVSEPKGENIFPVYGGNGIMGYASEYNSIGDNILIGRVGEYCGITRFVNEKCWVTDNALYTKKFLKEIDTRFLVFKLQKENLSRLRNKGGQPLISQGPIAIHKVVIPKDIPEQHAIAHVLSLMDTTINKNNQLIAQKELHKKWLMQNLLTGKKRLKGYRGEWKKVKLGQLFTQIKYVNDGGNGHSVMTISAKLGLISQQDKFDRIIAGDSLKKYTQLRKGDFAYNKGNSKTYQMGCVYQLEDEESALVPFVYICFSPTDLVDPKYYKHWFLAHGLDRQLKRIITSGARGDGLLNVNKDDFFNLRTIYPPKEEQTAIAQVLQAADKEIQLLKTKTEKLREQKKGMMQVLLTGKKRLKIV